MGRRLFTNTKLCNSIYGTIRTQSYVIVYMVSGEAIVYKHKVMVYMGQSYVIVYMVSGEAIVYKHKVM